MNDLELFKFVKTNQVQARWRAVWKCSSNECWLSYVRHFHGKTIIAKPLRSKCSDDEKHVVLTWRNTLIKQVRSYIIIMLLLQSKYNRSKDNFIQPLSVKWILDELEISKNDYCRILSIWKDEDLELHLKRQANFCFL